MDDERPFELSTFTQQQRDRLPEITSQIENVVRRADPIELLSHLTVLYQTHPEGAGNDRDDKARWQAKIEWLAWLTFAREASPRRNDRRSLMPSSWVSLSRCWTNIFRQ